MTPEQAASLVEYIHWFGAPFQLVHMLPYLGWLIRALQTAMGW